MDQYTELIDNITMGHHRPLDENITIQQAVELLDMAIENFGLTKGPNYGSGNDCAENKRFFAYVGEFPTPHLALDNCSGTTRLHTITTKEQLYAIK